MSVCDYKEPEQNDNESLDLPEGIPPLSAFYLYLSNSCNLACRHCWITPSFINGKPDPGDVIDINALQKAINEAKPLGLKSAKLTGGEPLVHPFFRDICALAAKEELNLVMETNGTLITPDLARYLKDETTMDFISVSIDSAQAGRHDAFRGVKGSFNAVLNGLDNLVTAGYENVQVIMSVHRGNKDELKDVSMLALEHGAASIKFSPVINNGRGLDMQHRGETIDFKESLALSHYIYTELGSQLKVNGKAIDLVHNTPLALMPITEIVRRMGNTGDCGVLGILGILGNGEIALCGIGRNIPDLVFGRLGKDSIRNIWFHHPTLVKLRLILADVDSYPTICRECKMAKQCRTGCVANNFVNSGQLVWTNTMCAEAYQAGLFPKTRQKLPFSTGTQAAKSNFA